MLRTHTCGELKRANSKEYVTLAGWVNAKRSHGKLIFIDLRDRYGITQIVVIPKEVGEYYKTAEKIKNEYVILVKGIVNNRPDNMVNKDLKTGEIEVIAKSIEILSGSNPSLFPIEDNITAEEETKFKYRFLDLRRPVMQKNLILRHKITFAVREFFHSRNFLEIETPLLIKSTPEGARDYLVPNRRIPGQFYALPQSPQMLKQILMVCGFDRYFQIAKCFRDEDFRTDRQPEFTQIDVEMSFINEDDIMSITEEMIKHIFSKVLDNELETPFPRITYDEAVKKYGNDKPNIGKNKFNFIWVTDFPMFEYDKKENKLKSYHHPFTSPKKDDLKLLDSNPSSAKARAYDLVLNGSEIGSGSIRINTKDALEKVFKVIGLSKTEIMEKFGFLFRAFDYGVPPHGGIALGFDRICMLLAGADSIRDVIAFPKTTTGQCLLTGAPSEVSEEQLKELKLKVENGG